MKKAGLFLFLPFICGSVHAQLRLADIKNPPTKAQTEESYRNMHCKTTEKYSAEERRAFFPFSRANKVKLISFVQPPSVIMGGSIPLKSGALDTGLVKEVQELSPAEVDSLTHILYNIVYKGYFFTETDIKCYRPRNAIVFYNDAGKLLAYIELCFECKKNVLSTQRIKTGDFCEEKYELLKDFFARMGIKYGVVDEEAKE